METFSKDQELSIATILAYLRDAALPIRSPGYEKPGYWDLPVTRSSVVTVPNTPIWQTLQDVESPDEYNTLLREYIACPLLLPYPAGLQFRIRVDEGILDMNLPNGIDRHHSDGENVFNLIRQKVQYVLSDHEHFVIEVRNTTGGPVTVASAVYGWHYYNPIGNLSESGQPQTDAGAPARMQEEVDAHALRYFDE
ncbi:MAG: hypothetical protein F6K48_03040 [Okeania sp. SIO3H1]|nr:hypothetical protein [Okeania sp. SIO3H1]